MYIEYRKEGGEASVIIGETMYIKNKEDFKHSDLIEFPTENEVDEYLIDHGYEI